MRFIALVTILATMPAVAGAQPADSFQQLTELLELGEDVTVVYGRGQVAEGRALDVSPTQLTLMTAGARLELDEAAVQRVRQRWHDSTRDGALFGFALGSVPWWVLYLTWAEAEMEPITGKGLTVMTLLSSATGLAAGLVGASMDAGRMQMREIYRRPDAGRRRMSLGPLPRVGDQPLFQVAAGAHVSLRGQPVKRDWLVSSGFRIGQQDYVVEAAWSPRTHFHASYTTHTNLLTFTPHTNLLTIAGGISSKPTGEQRFTLFHQMLVGGARVTNRSEFAGEELPDKVFVSHDWRLLLQPGAGLDVGIRRRLKVRLTADLLVTADRFSASLYPRMSIRVVVGL